MRAPGRAAVGDSQATLLYGAGEAGVLVARSARRYQASGVRPVGFLDDDPALAGDIVSGLRVFGGLEALEGAIAATGATSLLITMPSASGDAIRRAMEAALANQLEVRTVPPVTDLIDGSVDAHRIRRVRVEDLLRRPIVTQHAVNVEEIIRDRTVVITGGAGSIGPSSRARSSPSGPAASCWSTAPRARSTCCSASWRRGEPKGEGPASCAFTWPTSRAVHRWIG